MKPDIYKKLAASGRFVNTGKVLIGLQHIPVQRRQMSRDEERLQRVLLGQRFRVIEHPPFVYTLYVIGVCLLIAAIAEMVK